MAASRTILIAGAGIGGLTASLALAARGFRVVILERAERLEEIGAGLQLSPNASRVLIELGMRPYLESQLITPEAISIATARTGREVCRIPLGDAVTFRYGAPYWVIRRADLQAALVERVRHTPDVDLRLGSQFEDVAIYGKGVTVVQRKDTARHQEPGLALIGADGVWSTVRNHLFPDIQPRFTGRVAWRGIVEADQLPREFNARRVQLWMGSNAHVVAYPLSDGRRINVVVILSGPWSRPGWNEAGSSHEIAGYFSSGKWPIATRTMIGAVENWRKWALFAMPDGGIWRKGPIALMGDASHAMLPFLAQGASSAIEDATVLAKCLEEGQTDVASAFARYESLRASRIARVQRAARRMGAIYHLHGAIAVARDQVIRALGGARLLERQDWLYDWREA